jgi:MFS family permease
VRLNSTSRQLGILFGPAVGGALMLLLSPSMGLVVNTLIYLPLTIWLLTVPYTGHSREGAAPARRAIGWNDALQVLREVSANRSIVTMVVLAGCVSFFVGTAFQATMPEFAHDLGTDHADFAYSALLGANAAGAVFGGFLLEGRGWLPPKVSTAMLSAILWCLVIAGFALSTNYYLSLALLFSAGVLNLTFSSMGQTIVQLLSPPQLRGRLIGLFAMASMGLKAFSGVTVGVMGGLIGIHWSLAASALVLLAITVALFAFAIPGARQEEFG